MERSLRILFIEPFYGGSHQEFADGLACYSRHEIDLHTLPARFWKWRMRSSALYFFETIVQPEKYDLLLVTDMISITDLKALWGERCPPIVLYFHENQLSYPVPKSRRIDLEFGFNNITSALAADKVVFNSHYHKEAFLSSFTDLIKLMPGYIPKFVSKEFVSKFQVLYPGCRLLNFQKEHLTSSSMAVSAESSSEDQAPMIIWNHRWDYDKQPDVFFDCLRKVQEAHIPFRVALLGENFRENPREFIKAKEWLGDRIVQYGYLSKREDYEKILLNGSVVVSTAIQENFGISVVEAIAAGNHPLLPHRLSYPEVIPEKYHESCLYEEDSDLVEKLKKVLLERPPADRIGLSIKMKRYSWEDLIYYYDSLFEESAKRC